MLSAYIWLSNKEQNRPNWIMSFNLLLPFNI